jgi:hypothetical protein
MRDIFNTEARRTRKKTQEPDALAEFFHLFHASALKSLLFKERL